MKEIDEKIMPVGGQAVIEGVMMRSPKRLATAIRRLNGEIEVKTDEYVSLVNRKKYLNIPVIRGAFTLLEVMILGIKTLQWSADKAMEDQEQLEQKVKDDNKKQGMSTMTAVFTVSLALLLGIAIFFVSPLYLTTRIFNIENQAFLFNLTAGTIRISIFLLYIWGISFLKDVKRLFEYHGAEHKTIFAFENKLYLTPLNTRQFTTFHPRCGTSFLMIVMLISVLFFAFLDYGIISIYGRISFPIRLLTHLPFIPLIGGISYEALKASAKYSNSRLVKFLILPGLALQRITTSNPDDSQLEVAIQALKSALGEEYKNELVPEYPAATNQTVVIP
jgi:uncharacterized protein YqhQ